VIVVFGSINLDLIFPLPELPRPGATVLGRSLRVEPGGKGANQAVAAARDGARVVFAGAVGRDGFAEDALRLMRAEGIDLGAVEVVDPATGCAAICVDPQGRNQIAVASGANLAARQAQIGDDLLGPGTTVVLQMEVDAGETAALIRRARARGARVVLNLAPAGALDEAALRTVDVLVVNEEEAAWLAAHLATGADAASLHAALGCAVVTTLGGAGVAAAANEGRWRIAAGKIEVIDTTAAGDCFVGVLAAGLDRGLAFETALRRANIAAALCCTRRGTQDSLPRVAETDAALG
jgi:ribokinase